MEGQIVCDGVQVKVTIHAVDQYYRRIKGRHVRFSSGHERQQVKEKLAECAVRPDHVYHEKKDMAPIHILDNFAAVVDEEKAVESDTAVMTVYPKETFMET